MIYNNLDRSLKTPLPFAPFHVVLSPGVERG